MSQSLLVFLVLQRGKDMEGTLMSLPSLVKCKSFESRRPRMKRSYMAETSASV